LACSQCAIKRETPKQFRGTRKKKEKQKMKLLESLVSMTFILAAFAANVSYAADENAVPDISLADLSMAITNKTVTLIDCNGSKSYACGHIPGAINFADHKDDLAKVLPTDKAALVVSYCGGPLCEAYKAGSDEGVRREDRSG
jgi:predicted sulfurtransferase